MNSQPLKLAYLDSALPEDAIDDFRTSLGAAGIALEIVERKGPSVLAGLEWLMPTAVILYFGKSYIDGFLGEMGKDHYALLKRSIKSLQARISRAEFKEYTRQNGNWAEKPPGAYSSGFSIMADGSNGIRFKLLVDQPITPDRFEEAIDAFLTFLDSYHHKRGDRADPEIIVNHAFGTRTVLLAYDRGLGRLKVLDPLHGMPKR